MYNNDDGNENVEMRVINEENVKLFKERLSDVNWPNMCSSEDVKGNRTGHFVKVSLWYASLLTNTRFRFLHFRISNY